MKKLFLFAVVVAAMTIVGCSKKDSTMAANHDINVAPNGSDEPQAKLQPNHWGEGCITWRDFTTGDCTLERHSDSICGIHISCNQGVPMAIGTCIDEFGRITRVLIKNYHSLPNDADIAFENLISAGYVNIMYDAMITDQTLLSMVNADCDYIPAGTFPIYADDQDAVIEIHY